MRFSDRLIVEQEIDPCASNTGPQSASSAASGECNQARHWPGRRRGHILITAKLTDQQLVLSVEDSGSGEDENNRTLRFVETPFGLRSTAERLENLYGDGFSFNASTSRLGGLKLALHLPTRGKQK